MNIQDLGSVYPFATMDDIEERIATKRTYEAPRMIFLPNKEILTTMVKANLDYSKTDSLDRFLLRFGFLQDPNVYDEVGDIQ